MNTVKTKKSVINVAILDDHQTVLDGYAYRLQGHDNINVVATARYGNQLDEILENYRIDLLVLDVNVPSAEDDSNPFPLLFKLPQIHKEYPHIAILIISMFNHRTLVKAVMKAGAKGYIVKDDHDSIEQLAEIITSVAGGGVYFSDQSFAMLADSDVDEMGIKLLTPRQIQALSLCAASPDISTADLGVEMSIAASTARNMLSDIYDRLQVRNRAAAIAKARDLGLITPFPPDPEV